MPLTSFFRKSAGPGFDVLVLICFHSSVWSLDNVQVEDSGKYTCFVSDGVHTSSLSIVINVEGEKLARVFNSALPFSQLKIISLFLRSVSWRWF